jgi:hypothetical protein
MRRRVLISLLLLVVNAVVADDGTRGTNTVAAANSATANAVAATQGDVAMSGMSILGNDEAPKSLVLVPWKSSQLGDMPELSRLPDDAIKPVDKDVFSRELSYYQIRSDSK